jgi:hypothetical protein
VLRRRLRCRARRPVASRGARTAGLRLGAAATPTTSTSPPPPTPSTAKLSPDSPPRPPTMPLPTAWRAPPANSPPGNSPTLRATRGRLVPGACEPSRAPPALRVERTASASAPVDLASYPSWPRLHHPTIAATGIGAFRCDLGAAAGCHSGKARANSRGPRRGAVVPFFAYGCRA